MLRRRDIAVTPSKDKYGIIELLKGSGAND
jgi:hypothetical protein